jgi:hypothetical protein
MAPRPPLWYPKAVAMSNTRKPRSPAKPAIPDTISYLGAKYKVADKIGVWPQMMLARAAQEGVNLGDIRGLAAVHATLENVIDPKDWARFQADMIAKKADDLQALLDLVTQAATVVSARQQNGSRAAVNGAETNGTSEKADAAVPGSLQVNE